ncbi:MAG: CoA pyrophosphatase [Crocinitomicaceae bacterium]|nr:CoA pyrophosphatase [Crocinitomicaceae bacterium]
MPKEFPEQISSILATQLPGEIAHERVMSKKRPKTSEAKLFESEYRDSAVGIFIYKEKSSFKSLLIQRPDYEGTHGGQISFPGGKSEEKDESLEYTARRESFEEVGIPLGEGKLLGTLTEVYIPVSKFRVQPYVFYLDQLPKLTPDTYEVAGIIPFDLIDFKSLKIKHKSIPTRQGITLKNMAYFDIDRKVVWGATALMLSELQEVIRLSEI